MYSLTLCVIIIDLNNLAKQMASLKPSNFFEPEFIHGISVTISRHIITLYDQYIPVHILITCHS